MKYILFVILFIPVFLMGQGEYQRVRDHFDKPNADVKIITFKGLLNEVHPITIHIGYKNDQAHGYYRLMSSGEEIWLHGEYLNQSFTLSEIENAQVIGAIQFNNQIDASGIWSSNTNEHILPLQLKKVRFGEFVVPESKKKIICYSLNARKMEATIILEALYDDTYLLHSTINKRYQVQEINCPKGICDNIVIEDASNSWHLSLSGNQLFYTNHKKKKEPFNIQQEGTFETIAYASSDALFDVSYLKTSFPAYNQWIKSLIKNSKKEKIQEINDLKKEDSTNHFSWQWTGWQEIDYWTEKVISGRMVFFESWSEKTYTIPIIYDLETNKPLDLPSEFRKNNTEIIHELTTAESQKYNPNSYSDDALNTKLEVMSLVKNGILLTSPFDPINGYKKRVIPYKSFKRKLRKNSPIHQLLKS